jgi:thiol-disulfide isomerase/thioredoxin
MIPKLFFIALLLGFIHTAYADTEVFKPVNKLQYLYQLFYLPFEIDFKEGEKVDEIILWIMNEEKPRVLKASELKKLDGEWAKLREPWVKKSLLLSTPVDLGKSVRISPRLISHKIPIYQGLLDRINLEQRMLLKEELSNKSPEVEANTKQIVFLKSLLNKEDESKFNFFLVSASWCESCKEYRVLFETYAKTFPHPDLTLHSLYIDDPKEQIFEKPLLKSLFPNPKRYSHETIPRFIAMEIKDGKYSVWEEGEALKEVYERYFKEHRGFLKQKVSPFTKTHYPARSLSSYR